MMIFINKKYLCSASSLLLLCCSFIIVTTTTNAASSSESSSSTGSIIGKAKRPDFITVDRETIQLYMDKAKQQHNECITSARGAYNANPNAVPDDDILSNIQLKEYSINSAGGQLPDFQDELDRKLYVTSPTPLFTEEECNDLIQRAESHFANKGEAWSTLPSGQYDIAGFWIREIPEVHEWFLSMVEKRLFPLLAKQFPHFCDAANLVVDNAYLFKYTPETGRRSDVHTDSGCLSFTISLNPNTEYEGGGTWFEGLEINNNNDNNDETTTTTTTTDKNDNIIEMNIGQVTIRPGGVRHCGHAVTSGTRYIIGGFCMDDRKVEFVRMLLRFAHETTNPEEEQKALEVAIALNPNFDATYTVLADVYKKQGNNEKAKQLLQYCLDNVNPQCADVAYSLGSMYFEQGDYVQAKKCMQICLQVDDCDVEAMMMMAQSYQRSNDVTNEKQWYEKIVATPGATNKVVASACCNLGVLCSGTDKEIGYYKQSLQFAPDAFPTHYSLAGAYGNKQQWTDAIQSFRDALATDGGTDDERTRALKSLYRCVSEKVRTDPNGPPQTQDEMTTKFQNLMGKNNFDQLYALMKQR